MEKLNIPIILGTNRPGRRSEACANLVLEVSKQFDEIETFLVDVKDYKFEYDGDFKIPKYTEITKNADGFMIVTPEYNHSFPGSLKTLLDSELENYIHKAAAIVGVSKGRTGGTRAVESLIHVLRELGLVTTFEDVYFMNMKENLDENNQMNPEFREQMIPVIIKSFQELIWMTKALKVGRMSTKR